MRARLIVLLALAACDGASNDLGYGALIQIPGAQFRPSAVPGDAGGPPIAAVQSTHTTVSIDSVDEIIKGTLGVGSTAVIVGVEGDDASWIVTAGAPDFDTPDNPSFKIRAEFAASLPPGPFTIDFAGADENGTVGPTYQLPLVADAVPPPTGQLVIRLSWDNAADLDLHVVDPTGAEAWSGNPNTWTPPPPGTPPDPNAWMTGGILDRDANQNCTYDAEPREDVVWQMTPPSGTYTVRVDTPSMCTASVAYWYVTAYRADGSTIASARGVSTPIDTQAPHSTGAGVTAMTFTFP
jgi:hypothetical protein